MKNSTVFSIHFTRALLLVSIGMFGIIIGMQISNYHWKRIIAAKESEPAEAIADSGDAPSNIVAQSQIPQPQYQQVAPAAQDPRVFQQPQTQTQTFPNNNVAAAQSPQQNPSQPPAANPSSPATQDAWNDQLAALRQEQEIMDQRFRQMQQDGSDSSQTTRGSGPPRSSSAASQINPSAPSNNPPSSEQRLSPEKQRIVNAPVLTTVQDNNELYDVIILNGGTKSNISQGQKLAVRRGTEIIAIIEVEEVDENVSVAHRVDRHKSTDPQPQAGDDVISAKLF